jgi:hypothetical protein
MSDLFYKRLYMGDAANAITVNAGAALAAAASAGCGLLTGGSLAITCSGTIHIEGGASHRHCHAHAQPMGTGVHGAGAVGAGKLGLEAPCLNVAIILISDCLVFI